MTKSKTRQWHERKGRLSEALCSLFLTLKGYRILKTRYKTKSGEIDIIAKKGKRLIIIEVKTRPSLASALESISFRQRQRIQRALQYFLVCYQEYTGYDIRFDVMLVTPWRLHHLKNAWFAE
jgi:putative endonuclease